MVVLRQKLLPMRFPTPFIGLEIQCIVLVGDTGSNLMQRLLVGRLLSVEETLLLYGF